MVRARNGHRRFTRGTVLPAVACWIGMTGASAGLMQAMCAPPALSPDTTEQNVAGRTIGLPGSTAETLSSLTAGTLSTLTAEAGPNLSLAVGQTLALQGSASGGSPLYTYYWQQLSGVTLTITGGDTAGPSVSATAPGQAVLRLTVTDATGTTAADTMTITVTYSFAVNTSADMNAYAGGDTTLIATAINGVGIVRYSWQLVALGSAGTATLGNVNSRICTVAFSEDALGPFVFQVTATDVTGSVASDRVQVTVLPASNLAVTASATPPMIALPDTSTLSAAVSGGTPGYAFSWVQVSGPMATIANPSAQTTSVILPAVGTYSFTVTVADAGGVRRTSDPACVTATTDTPSKSKTLLWEAFDRDDQWCFTTATNWTKAVDTTNVKAGGQYSSAPTAAFGKMQSLRLTAPGENNQGVTITRTYPVALDLSSPGAILVLRFYMHPGEGSAAPEEFNAGGFVYLYDATGYYKRYQYHPASGKNHAGWVTWSVAIDNWGTKSDTAPNLAAISKINVNIQAKNEATGSITFDLLAVTEKPPFAYVSLGDDDWMGNAHQFVAALNARTLNDRGRYPSGHLIGTLYVCPGLIGHPSSYCSLAQLKAAYAEGHAVCPHIWDATATGWGEWHVLTLEQKRIQVDNMKRWIVENGMPGGERCLATSGGHINWADDLTLIEEGWLDQIRSAFWQYPGAQFKREGSSQTHNFDSLFDPRIIHISTTIAANDADLTWSVDKVAEVGGLLCVYGHNGALGAMTNFLDRVAELANAGLVEVVTAPELVRLTNYGE